MSAFNAAWFVLKKDEGLGEQPRASVEAQNFYDRRRGAIRGHHRGSSIPVEERRRMARAGEIDTSKGIFAPSPLSERKPKAPMGTNPLQGDETHPMESPAMLTTEQIAEREREDVPDRRQRLQFGKSSAFDAAWSMLKEDEMFKPEPSRQMQLDGSQPKGHPSTTYGMKTPTMTRKPTASLRTGAVPAQASEEDMEALMRINSPMDEDPIYREYEGHEALRDGKRRPADEMRLRGLQSVFSRPDKAAYRLSFADAMHGEDIQSIFEEQGIPVTSKVGEDIERNIDKPRPELEDDDKWYSAINRFHGN